MEDFKVKIKGQIEGELCEVLGTFMDIYTNGEYGVPELTYDYNEDDHPFFSPAIYYEQCQQTCYCVKCASPYESDK